MVEQPPIAPSLPAIVEQPPIAPPLPAVVEQPPTTPPPPATIHPPQYLPFSFYPDPNSNAPAPYAYAQSPQPVAQPTRQLPVYQHAIPVELVQRVSSPVSGYNIPKYGFVIPSEPNPGTNHGSSWSTEGPHTITPTTSAETQGWSPTPRLAYCSCPCSLTSGASINELVWPSNPIRTDEDGSLETSVIQTSYPTPDGRRIPHVCKPRFVTDYL